MTDIAMEEHHLETEPCKTLQQLEEYAKKAETINANEKKLYFSMRIICEIGNSNKSVVISFPPC
jgi:hypothetical protein